MSVTYADPVRLRGCGNLCQPYDHDPFAHRRDGYEAGYAAGHAAGHAAGYERAKAELAPCVVRTGPLVVDLNARTATVDGEDVALSGREWGVLSYLAERVDTHCTVNEIIAAVWGQEWIGSPAYGGSRYAASSSAVQLLSTTTSRLRQRLGPAGRLIVAGRAGSRTGAGRRLEMEPVQ